MPQTAIAPNKTMEGRSKPPSGYRITLTKSFGLSGAKDRWFLSIRKGGEPVIAPPTLTGDYADCRAEAVRLCWAVEDKDNAFYTRK